ncbi:MAG: F0F1 ATP synthase subunit delta [Candidatus Shapirobacteria bacterium]|jgi:F0F1-type ATP synthase delta subunit
MINKNRKTAVDIFLLSKENKDSTLLMLEILSRIEIKEIKSILLDYQKLLSGEIKIVNVSSAQELSDAQKQTLEKKVESEFKPDLVFFYEVEESLVSGFCFQIDDSLYDRTLNSFLD